MFHIKKIFLLICLASITITFAEAKTKPIKISNSNVSPTIKRPMQTSIIADVHTGNVLHSENATHKVHPASLTKMMTLYIAFSDLKNKKISMHTMLPVTKQAQKAKPCKLGLVAGQNISVGDAVMALIVKSANDVAVTVAEGLGGTEEQFAKKMNATAKSLGMHNTHFTNASGWHHPHQLTTAVDMAKLGLALRRDFPEYYPLFKKTSFTFKGKVIKGHNHVLAQYVGAEGLKTGYHVPAGFNVVTTASRNGKSLIGVVMGGETAKTRDKKMMTLLDKHFGITNTHHAANDSPTSSYKKSPSKKTISTNKKYSNVKIASANSKLKKRSKTRA